ncbi:hypothetical protein INR49_024621 [Caranx melampygus]|nr:hypothetical protein INR49_024621 [Caranx melampygus]
MSRKRSMVWRFFRTVDSQSVKCVLCRGYQARYVQGSTTTAMLRHLRVKHPKEVAKKCKGRAPGAVPRNVNQDVEMDSERYCFVEVLLEDEGSDIHTTLDKSNMNGIREPTQENPAEQLRHVGASDNHSVRQGRHQRSLIWRHFERLDSSNACCRICMRKLQCSEGSTSNLHRHMSKRHPELFAKLSGLKPPPSRSSQGLTANGDTSTPAEIVGSTEQGQISVEVLLEDEGSDIHTTLDKSNMNGIREPTQENPAEQLRHVGAMDMLLEDEDPDSHTTMDESDISSAINGILESAQEDPQNK